MPFWVTLFKINFSGTYYKDGGIENDLSIVPSKKSQYWMEKWKVRVVSSPACLQVIWLTDKLGDPLRIFKNKLAGATLSFYVVIQNPNLVNFSSLDVGGDQVGYSYYFYNKQEHNRLHIGEYVTKKDLVLNQDIANYPVRTEKNILGVIDIHLGTCMAKKEFFNQNSPICYVLNIKAKETIWRYVVVDVNKKNKKPMKVTLGNNDTYFTHVMSTGVANMYTYESVKPMPLSNKPEIFFSLKTYSKDAHGITSEILIKKLPLPAYNSLSKGGPNKKNLYSDIIVYV